jgi:hypothetical protein
LIFFFLQGTYSRFMSKCKVVDLNGMSEEQQQIEMEKHAQGPNGGGQRQTNKANSTVTSAPVPAASAAVKQSSGGMLYDEVDNNNATNTTTNCETVTGAQVEQGFESLRKGFLSSSSGNGGSLYGDEGSSEGGGGGSSSSSSSNMKDAVFESLCEGIDPDYADASTPLPDPSEAGAFESLGAIAKLLSGGEDVTGAGGLASQLQLPTGGGGDDGKKKKKLAVQARGIDTDEVVQTNESIFDLLPFERMPRCHQDANQDTNSSPCHNLTYWLSLSLSLHL